MGCSVSKNLLSQFLQRLSYSVRGCHFKHPKTSMHPLKMAEFHMLFKFFLKYAYNLSITRCCVLIIICLKVNGLETNSKKISKKGAQDAVNAAAPSLHGLSPYQEQEGEEYMNEEQRNHFQAILQAWRQELMEEVDRTVIHMQDEAANFPDPADRATQEEEFSLELRARDRERKLIRKIDKTLIRVQENDYGFCDQCGIDIGVRRLEARPTADLSVDCKTLDEIKEKQLGG